MLAIMLLFGGFVSHASVTTQSLSLSQVVDLLISIDVIAPDKIEAARAIISGNNNPITAQSISTAQATSTQTTTISSCREIKSPGNYVVDKNLQSSGFDIPCLNVHDAENVHIICNNHLIKSSAGNAILVSRVKNFSIKSCRLEGGNLNQGLDMKNVMNGEIADNKITSGLNVMDGVGMKILRNSINGIYQQFYTTGSRIDSNTIDSWNPSFGIIFAAGSILSTGGSNNNIINNNIDGRAQGILSIQIGADDGIIISDEDRDFINNNTIANTWDCSIETLGFISNTTISDNSLKNAGLCGIGGWHWNSFKGNTVANNTINDAPRLFYFGRSGGLRNRGWDRDHTTPMDDKIYFKDNVFENNKLTNPRLKGVYGTYSTMIMMDYASDISSFDRQPASNDYILGNNVFKNNNFSLALDAPIFSPAGMIVDGGGNICSTSASIMYPIKCNDTSPVVTPVVTIPTTPVTGSQTITPNLRTIVSGQIAQLYFTYPSNTIKAQLYISCPSGVGIGGAKGNITDCNTFADVTNLPSVMFQLINTTTSLADVVPAYYIYTSDNPNYANAVSVSITIQAGQTPSATTTVVVPTAPVATGPTINSFSVTPASVTRGENVTFSGKATTQSGYCITKHRAIVVGSATPSWAPPDRWMDVGCVQSVDLSGTVGTAVNPYSFSEGKTSYEVIWQVQDSSSQPPASRTQTVTVNPAPTSMNTVQSNLGSALISFEEIMKLLNALSRNAL